MKYHNETLFFRLKIIEKGEWAEAVVLPQLKGVRRAEQKLMQAEAADVSRWGEGKRGGLG